MRYLKKKPLYSAFKAQHEFSKRKDVADKIINKYPERLPVIVERAPLTGVPEIAKKKYLVPMEISVGKFTHEIRKHISLSPEQALFLFVNGNLPATGSQMCTLYEKYKDDDGFLYIMYSGENAFGAL